MSSASSPLRAPNDAPGDSRIDELRQEISEAIEESDKDGWLTPEEVWRDVLGEDADKEVIDLR